jgi:hypothetical protein
VAKNDLRAFSKRVRMKAKYVTKHSDELTRKVALAVVRALLDATPVRTGRARTNWRTLLYKADNVLYWPLPDKPPSPQFAYDRALQEAEETIGIYTGGRRSIWIINNVPYIRDLNRGTSAQAPAGFVEAAVAAGRAEIANAKPILADTEY